MDTSTALLDPSILIEYFRKQDKSKSILFQLVGKYHLSISAITVFEIKIGIQTQTQQNDYDILTKNIEILHVDSACIAEAVVIFVSLETSPARDNRHH